MSTPPPPAAVPAGPRPTGRTGLYLGIATAIAVVMLVVVVLVVPPLTGPNASAAGPVLTYSGARAVADRTVAGFQGGGWTLVVAAGLVSNVTESFPLNTSAFGSIGCTFTSMTPLTNLSVPGYNGSRLTGASPAWEFLYRNSGGTLALVSVIDGTGTTIGTLTGFECSLYAQVFTPIPGNAIDSPQAIRAVQPEAQAFMIAHPNASVELALVGGISVGGGPRAPEWAVSYTTCPLSSSSSGTGAVFNATINATSGGVVRTNATGNASCGSVGLTLVVLAPGTPVSPSIMVRARPA